MVEPGDAVVPIGTCQSLKEKEGKETTNLFFAERPVRPGKYVLTILVHTLPCSSTALRRISSCMDVS